MMTQEITEARQGKEGIGWFDGSRRDDLILEYAPQIKYIAHQLLMRLPSHVLLDDLISAGVIGLIDAIDKFDPTRNIQFKTYATFRIRGAMLDDLRAQDWVPRSVRQKTSALEKVYAEIEQYEGRPATDEEAAAAMKMPLEEFYDLVNSARGVSLVSMNTESEDEGSLLDRKILDSLTAEAQENPLTLIKNKELKGFMAQVIDQLPEKEKMVVSLYYYEELNMKEIGTVLHVTESRVSQIHSKAVLRMRGKLREFLQ